MKKLRMQAQLAALGEIIQPGHFGGDYLGISAFNGIQ